MKPFLLYAAHAVWGIFYTHRFNQRTVAGSMRRQRRFTLIELIVVIFIIGLIIGLLLPALGADRDAARSVACVSNLKDYGTAYYVYAAENDDRIVAPAARSSGNATPDINFDNGHTVATWNELLMDAMIRQESSGGGVRT